MPGPATTGSSRKTVITPAGELELNIPRDRLATFEPQLVAKQQRRLPGFDDHVISMYARGMSVREIQGHLLELYGLQVSPNLINSPSSERTSRGIGPFFKRSWTGEVWRAAAATGCALLAGSRWVSSQGCSVAVLSRPQLSRLNKSFSPISVNSAKF